MKKPNSKKIKIAIVDDHPIVREGLKTLIEREPDMTVCCCAGSPAEFDQCFDAGKALNLLITDISMQGRSGLELIKDIVRRMPGVRIVVVSIHDESTYIERALRAGANGYVSKQEAPEVMIEAIRTVLSGQSYISPSLVSSALRLIGSRPKKEQDSRVESLSDRELEVLEHIGHGRGTSEIARILNLSVNTIQTHRRHIIEKLGIPSSGLVKFAVEWLSGGL